MWELNNGILYIKDCHIDGTNLSEGEDAITVYGRAYKDKYPDSKQPTCDKAIIENVLVDFRFHKKKLQDEAISGVAGAKVEMRNCTIIGSTKAILAGNGDFPDVDKVSAEWDIENCVFLNCGRRLPEAQHGTKVQMRNCWVHNFGYTFDTRVFGAWAHSGASIYAQDVLYTQKSLMKACGYNPLRLFIDFGYHFGQAFNDRPSKLRDYVLSGYCRAATASTTADIVVDGYYTNKWWLYAENAKNNRTKEEARAIVKMLNRLCPMPIDMPSLLEIFDAEV